MFTVLISGFPESVRQELLLLCPEPCAFVIPEQMTWKSCVSALKKQTVHCFFFYLDEDYLNVRKIAAGLRSTTEYAYTPILFFSDNIRHILFCTARWKLCELFLLPLSHGRSEMLRGLLQYYVCIYEKIHFPEASYCRLHTPKAIYTFLYSDILFIESSMKKVLIHTKKETLTIPVPLYRMEELLEHRNFIKTHRAFIVNVNNISFVDKTTEPWTISFFQSDELAYASRGYRKNLTLLPEGPQDGKKRLTSQNPKGKM